MKRTAKIAIVAALLAAASGVLALKFARSAEPGVPAASAPATDPTTAPAGLPRLLELGSTVCTPCKLMKPVLAALRREYPGRLRVDFIDVKEDEPAGEKWDVWVLPTQVFLAASGKELFRHEGFLAKEDILRKWKELGVDLGPPAGAEAADTARSPAGLGGLFSSLTRAVEGAAAAALGAAFLWGILSVLLSPCHLASIPLIVGFINGQGPMSTPRAFGISTLFSVGILITIGAIGAITAAAGRMMGDLGGYANYAVAVIFFLVGLHLLDVIPAPWSGPGQVGMKRKGALAAFVLGLVFGIALGPCTFAYMAPMLAVTFKLAATSLAYGIALLAVYGVGHCSVIVLAGTSTELVQRYLNWNERSKGAGVVKKACGALVLLGGLYLVHIA